MTTSTYLVDDRMLASTAKLIEADPGCDPYGALKTLDHPGTVCVLAWLTVHQVVSTLIESARPRGPHMSGINMVEVGRMAAFCIVEEDQPDGSVPESAPMLRRALDCTVSLRDEIASCHVRHKANELVLVVGDLHELRPDLTGPAFASAVHKTVRL
jgi:hypothetical protein